MLELMVTLAGFMLLSIVLAATLADVTKLWRRSDARNEAARQLLKAKASLMRDLSNSCAQRNQYATDQVPPSSSPAPALAGLQGDALTFLSTDSGTTGYKWTTSATGKANVLSEISYYLAVPDASNAYGVQCSSGAPDANGYEQQDPFKWLMRQVAAAPTSNPPVIDPLWVSCFASAPSLASTSPTLQIVADQMLGFRVLQSGPTWTIELSAVSVSEATHVAALGKVPLSTGPFTMVEQITVLSRN